MSVCGVKLEIAVLALPTGAAGEKISTIFNFNQAKI